MPSVSPKQHRFMEAVAHNPSFAKRAGVPQSVGREFVQADTGKSPIQHPVHIDKARKIAHSMMQKRIKV